MFDILGYLTNAINSPNGLTTLLILIIAGSMTGFVYAVRKFESVHNSFIEFIKENNEMVKDQLETCEKRCRDNADQFFRTIDTLVDKLDKR
jgi:hypothetical protein